MLNSFRLLASVSLILMPVFRVGTLPASEKPDNAFDIIIRNGTVYDGSG